jgi:hypothetical protein
MKLEEQQRERLDRLEDLVSLQNDKIDRRKELFVQPLSLLQTFLRVETCLWSTF